MKVYQIDYSRLPLWSHTDLAYIQHDKSLDSFISYPVGKEVFEEVVSNRRKFPVDRSLLLGVLKKQYNKLGIDLPVAERVITDENTFTVTTAHQPTLFTGPLYHIYKIASTINLSKEINASLSGMTILPVFIIGGEDHDWEEVNHFNLFGRKYVWERSASGACGRLSLDGLDALIKTVGELFSYSPFGKDINDLLKGCLAKANNYGEFHQLLIHSLFSSYGLIVLNMDDADLKKAFIPLMEKEITERFSIKHVPVTQAALEKQGYKAQAYCRPVNLFYMMDQRRERLDPIEGGLLRVESGVQNTIPEIVQELHEHPERFSPNVIMRPLYQESILPNLAYIGGGGEIAYWLERKSQFEAAGVHYPMLIRRNSLMLIDGGSLDQMAKTDLLWEDLLADYDAIVKSYLLRHSQSDLAYTKELEMIKNAHLQLAAKAEKIDPTLAKAILAEETKQSKQFDQLASRLLRAEKQLQETHLKRIQKLKEKLFPEGGLQERQESFLSFYATYGPQWIETMVRICNPLEEKFTVVELRD
jgi:bacillithiol biosynthesis cysteine-adding enzyme BshC